MTTRRLPLVIGTVGLAAASALSGVLAACGEDGLGDAAARDNGCIGSSCYSYDANPGTGADGSSGGLDASDGAIVYGNPLDGVDLNATLVKGGFVFTEGPIWAGGHLLFSDTGQNAVFRLEDDGSTTTVRQPSGGANGNAVDKQGRLVECEGNRGRVTRSTDPTFTMFTSVADSFNGKPFDSPNDVIVRDDGTIYFTDPAYNAPPDGGYPQDKQAVYRVPAAAANAQSATRLPFDFQKANGIALSPDGNTLYVVDNAAGKILSAKLNSDGTLNGTFTAFVDAAGGDGMCVDRAGNVYVAANAGVLVFDSAGAPLGTIKVTGTPSNVAFGGSDHKKLFITARTNGGAADPNTGVYAITLGVPGNP